MGTCKYCNLSAGFLKSAHRECEQKYLSGMHQMKTIAANDLVNSNEWDTLENRLTEIAKINNIPLHHIQNALIESWERAVKHFLEDNFLSKEEEHSLFEFQSKFHLNESELNQNGVYSKVGKCSVLRDIMEGNIPSSVQFTGEIPFNLQKQEALVWMFNNVDFFEEKTSRQYVGGYAGVSVKIAKGLYYRTGVFKGHPVEKSAMVHIDSGKLGITTKQIYFAGTRKSLRIPYQKIVNFTPYEDGLGIHSDGKTSKPQVFRVEDGWFVFNLVKNLSQI